MGCGLRSGSAGHRDSRMGRGDAVASDPDPSRDLSVSARASPSSPSTNSPCAVTQGWLWDLSACRVRDLLDPPVTRLRRALKTQLSRPPSSPGVCPMGVGDGRPYSLDLRAPGLCVPSDHSGRKQTQAVGRHRKVRSRRDPEAVAVRTALSLCSSLFDALSQRCSPSDATQLLTGVWSPQPKSHSYTQLSRIGPPTHPFILSSSAPLPPRKLSRPHPKCRAHHSY